ncbi:MAG: hypothetical protein D6730_12745 [Bacteroidetes bacterium]|nr:MAG: hypothetical protein D6730_12745 [Bacteroidota bacterium]
MNNTAMNNPYIFVFSCLLLLIPGQTAAQSLSRSILGAAGSANEQLSYTVGETVIQQVQTGTLVLSQGFQQPDQLVGTFVDPLGQAVEFRLYPTPTRRELTLELNSQRSFLLEIVLLDARGRQVRPLQRLQLQQQQSLQLPVDKLAAGSYTLLLQADGRRLQSLRFQKVD